MLLRHYLERGLSKAEIARELGLYRTLQPEVEAAETVRRTRRSKAAGH